MAVVLDLVWKERTRNEALVLLYVPEMPLGEGILGQRRSIVGSVTSSHSAQAIRFEAGSNLETWAGWDEGEPAAVSQGK